LTIEKPDGVKTGDIMIVTIAQKESDDSDPISMGWTVAGADLEEGKGRIRMVKVSFCFVK
jgi:hypothetical protein